MKLSIFHHNGQLFELALKDISGIEVKAEEDLESVEKEVEDLNAFLKKLVLSAPGNVQPQPVVPAPEPAPDPAPPVVVVPDPAPVVPDPAPVVEDPAPEATA